MISADEWVCMTLARRSRVKTWNMPVYSLLKALVIKMPSVNSVFQNFHEKVLQFDVFAPPKRNRLRALCANIVHTYSVCLE